MRTDSNEGSDPGCQGVLPQTFFFNVLNFTAVLTLGTRYAHRSAERMLPLASSAPSFQTTMRSLRGKGTAQ